MTSKELLAAASVAEEKASVLGMSMKDWGVVFPSSSFLPPPLASTDLYLIGQWGPVLAHLILSSIRPYQFIGHCCFYDVFFSFFDDYINRGPEKEGN